MKTFSDKEKLWNFVANRPALQEMLKGLFQKEKYISETQREEYQRRNK